MLKIGAFTFGGGYAMLALLESELVDRRAWLEKEEFLDMAAIAESTPGPIAINAATYVGYRRAGFLGATVATLGVVLPSFAIIYAISLFFDAFLAFAPVAYAFRGLQVGVIYLIFTAGLRMLRALPRKPLPLTLVCVTVAAMLTLSLLAVNFSSIFYILAGGLVGLCTLFAGKGKGDRK
jgi:chromate transporter